MIKSLKKSRNLLKDKCSKQSQERQIINQSILHAERQLFLQNSNTDHKHEIYKHHQKSIFSISQHRRAIHKSSHKHCPHQRSWCSWPQSGVRDNIWLWRPSKLCTLTVPSPEATKILDTSVGQNFIPPIKSPAPFCVDKTDKHKLVRSTRQTKYCHEKGGLWVQHDYKWIQPLNWPNIMMEMKTNNVLQHSHKHQHSQLHTANSEGQHY